MKNVLTVSFFLASLMGSSFALADVKTLVTCRDLNPVPDHSYDVEVTQWSCGNIPGRMNCHSLGMPKAVLTENTIAGPMVIGEYDVTLTQAKCGSGTGKCYGAPYLVVGQDEEGNTFRLSIVVDAAPRADGGHFSRLEAETKNGKVAAELSCKLIKM